MDPETWQVGEKHLIPSLWGTSEECEITDIQRSVIFFRDSTGSTKAITRNLLARLADA